MHPEDFNERIDSSDSNEPVYTDASEYTYNAQCYRSKTSNQRYGNNTGTNSETSTGHTETKPPRGEEIKLQFIDAAQNNYITSETEFTTKIQWT